jgi:uncharacterized protein (DUF362 family)/NAD-dependent dihydropyrimidine dehydrogenase PreA subunit
MPQVCIVKIKDQEEDIHNAIKSCFNGIPANDLKGVKKALIKPNFVVGLPAFSGTTTDLRIIKSLVEILKEKGIEVIVGESSLDDTAEVFKTLNVYKLEELGAKVVNFDEQKWIKIESSTKLALKSFHLPEAVFDCDLIMSVAKLKVHDQTGVTLSVKNILGMIPKSDRKVAHIIDINKAIVDVFAYLVRNKKFFSFVDGIYAMEGKGSPTHGKPVKMDLLVAGDDAVATDATCVEIMGYDVKKIKHLMIAEELGLGETSNREIIGEKIESVKRKFEMPLAIPSFKSYLFSYAMDEFFKRTSYLRYRERCTGCKMCIKNCPIGNITLENGMIKTNKKNCIGCMICVESCKEGALDYEVNHYFIYMVLKKMKELASNVTSLIKY